MKNNGWFKDNLQIGDIVENHFKPYQGHFRILDIKPNAMSKGTLVVEIVSIVDESDKRCFTVEDGPGRKSYGYKKIK